MRGASPVSEHDAQYDAQTLCRAEEIRADSKRMKAVKRHVQNMHKAVGRGKSRRKTRE